jgi:hypothetical protein
VTSQDTGNFLTARTVYLLSLITSAGFYFLAASPFFLFDDHAAISQNTALLNFDPANLYDWIVVARSSDSGPLGRPLTMLSFGLDSLIHGQPEAAAMKITNVVIHLICAMLAGWLGYQVARSVYLGADDKRAQTVGALLAILWCMAPIQVSTVLYPVQRMAQLSGLFVLLGLCLFMHFRAAWEVRGASPGTVVGTLLWLALVVLFAVLAKENGVLLLWLITLAEVLLFRGRWAGRTSTPLKSAGMLLFFTPAVIAAVVFLLYSEWLNGGYLNREFSLYERVLTEARVLWHYVGWIVFPSSQRLAFSHDYFTLSSGLFTPLTTLFSIAAWGGMVLVAYRWRIYFPWFAFGLGLFLIGHSIESSVLALELVFEHRNYLPSVGILLIVSFAVIELGRRIGEAVRLLLMAALMLVFGSVLFARTQAWSNQFTLAESNVRHHSESPRAHFFLARAYELPIEQSHPLTQDQEVGLLSAAREQYKAMLALDSEALAPSVLLYFIDDIYFPGNPEREIWLDNIERGAEKEKMSASDRNAMSSFFSCAMAACKLERARGDRIIEKFNKSQTVDASFILYSWLVSNHGSDSALDQLQFLERSFPGDVKTHFLLLDKAVQENNIHRIYQSLANIYRVDRDFRQLTRLQSLIDE